MSKFLLLTCLLFGFATFTIGMSSLPASVSYIYCGHSCGSNHGDWGGGHHHDHHDGGHHHGGGHHH